MPGPLFSTDRMDILPPWTAGMEFWSAIYQDPKMMTYLGGPFSEEHMKQRVQKWIDHWKEHGYGTGIIRLRTGEFTGTSALFWTEIDGEKLIEIG